jgi:omega-amidase
MRITAIQSEIRDGEAEENLRRALEGLNTAPASDVYLLPELFTTGYAYDQWDDAADHHTPDAVERLRAVAGEKDATLFAGMIARNGQGKLANRLWLLRGNSVEHYDKIHLIAAFREPELLACGTQSLMTSIGDVRIHASVCFDLRFPELYRAAALDGAEVFLIISEWPAKRMEAFLTLARARAMENQAYVALCNRIGDAQDGTSFTGGSQIIDPEGNVIAQAGSGTGSCSAEIDAERVRKLRRDFPVLQMSRRHW